MSEPATTRSRCEFILTDEGNTARVHIDPDASPKARAAINQLVDAVHARILTEDQP